MATFCLDPKALPAAEQFLLSRYTLHEQVYLHKTTRCIEAMIGKLLRRIAEVAADPDTASAQTGLEPSQVLLRFFAPDGETIGNYLALDDMAITGSLEQMQQGKDPVIARAGGTSSRTAALQDARHQSLRVQLWETASGRTED